MATVLTEPETEYEMDYDPSEPDIALLEDKMPDWFRTSPATAGWVLIVGVSFVVLNLRPLWHTDLWGHLAYARQIWQTGGLPVTETLMPLSEGVRFVDSAWLTQLLAYGAYGSAGAETVQRFDRLLMDRWVEGDSGAGLGGHAPRRSLRARGR